MMEKITATFLFLTLIGTLLDIASASGSNETSTLVQNNQTVPNTTLDTSSSTKISLSSFTTPAMPSGGNATTMNGTLTTPNANQTKEGNTTTPMNGNLTTPTTNKTKDVTSTTPKYVSAVTTKNIQTPRGGVTPGPGKQTPPTTKPPPKTTKTKHHKEEHSASTTYIIIILVIILCIVGAIGYCFYQNKTRTFSLDRNSKSEDAHIPLSAVEPEVFEASTSKDMETFAVTETTGTAESTPPAEAVEIKEEEKALAAPAEATQPEKESSAESQATVPLDEKPGELIVVDLNDGEQAVSNKTSIETLEETPNENNSNNRAQAHVNGANGNFTEITLDDLL